MRKRLCCNCLSENLNIDPIKGRTYCKSCRDKYDITDTIVLIIEAY